MRPKLHMIEHITILMIVIDFLFSKNNLALARIPPRQQSPSQTTQKSPVSISVTEGARFCTMKSFKRPEQLERLPIQVNWQKTENRDSDKFDIKIIARRKSDNQHAYKFEGRIDYGLLQLNLKVDQLIGYESNNRFGFKSIPASMEFSAVQPNQPPDKTYNQEPINIQLCSFGDLAPGAYQVIMSNIPEDQPPNTSWFSWKQAPVDAPYGLLVRSTTVLQNLSSLLANVEAFRIETARFSVAGEGVFLIKEGVIIAKFRNMDPDDNEISKFKNVVGATITFAGKGESWQTLRGSFPERMTAIDTALRIHERVYILTQSQLIEVSLSDIKVKAMVVRATLMGAKGFFTDSVELK